MDDHASNECSIFTGVLQGTVLGPCFFSALMTTVDPPSSVIINADDFLLTGSGFTLTFDIWETTMTTYIRSGFAAEDLVLS